MKAFNLFLIFIVFTGCAHKNGGFYNRDTSNTYSVHVGGAIPDPKYTLQRGAYEICKKNHGQGGYELLKNDWEYGESGGSAIKARFKCTGKNDKFLEGKFLNEKSVFTEFESPLGGFEKKYEIE